MLEPEKVMKCEKCGKDIMPGEGRYRLVYEYCEDCGVKIVLGDK